ncbi:MAG: hypothetical protein JW956_00765 [Calditrichaceae bacterium]|nr:hypothetical protein [Calditrichaceae bacterium]
MFNDSTREKLLEKILNSKEFSNSSIYGNYLNYLVNAAIEGITLKETTIAIDFFGKDAEFNPAEDTIVRSHTYTLRKKLERYYFTEGRKDKYRLRIPKGHYETIFEEAPNNIYSGVYLASILKKYYPLIIILSLIIVIAYLLNKNNIKNEKIEAYQIIDSENFIWKEYIHSELPILIIPGDHFTFDIFSQKFNRSFSVRDVTINSMEDLDALKEKFGDNTLQPAPEPYFPYHSIWGLPPVLSVLFSANQKPILRKSSDISPQILDEYNIIFLGSIKTLYALKHTVERSNFYFTISPHTITYSPSDSTKKQIFKTSLHSSGQNEDLVLALKLPGPAKNTTFIIASYHSLGVPEIANYLVDEGRSKELHQLFIDKYGHTPKYFELLFKVIGIDKTAYATEILIYNEIEEFN